MIDDLPPDALSLIEDALGALMPFAFMSDAYEVDGNRVLLSSGAPGEPAVQLTVTDLHSARYMATTLAYALQINGRAIDSDVRAYLIDGDDA